jgi:hypothetical protein
MLAESQRKAQARASCAEARAIIKKTGDITHPLFVDYNNSVSLSH